MLWFLYNAKNLCDASMASSTVFILRKQIPKIDETVNRPETIQSFPFLVHPYSLPHSAKLANKELKTFGGLANSL
jgi:hypothetical protein